jgi:teichuronic acid biosynthesis glycosyltransferase TuaG
MKYPKVSLIIPFHHDRGYLDQAIQSVHNQTYEGEIELILSESKNSVGYNINRGVEIATGQYIKYLCDDDKLTLNSISDSVKAMKGVDFIHGNAINKWTWREEFQRPRKAKPSLYEMLDNNVIHGGTLMYSKELFDKVGLFDESLDCAEEYEFNLRCLSKGMKIGYCNATLYIYRRHDEQKSLGKGIDQSVRNEKITAIKNRFR